VLTGGDPLALKLQRGVVIGTLGIAALASVALGRPLLRVLAERVAILNPERPEIQARLAEPDDRRAMTILTAIVGLTFTLDGASQIALALTVPTRTFVADSTATRIVVLGIGLLVAAWYLRHQKDSAMKDTDLSQLRAPRIISGGSPGRSGSLDACRRPDLGSPTIRR
jgi:hypothetical protein